jgi:hypothetical protein
VCSSAELVLFLVRRTPAWLGPGLLDWWCHWRTHIEEVGNGGTKESLVHSAMFAEAGIPLLLAAVLEMNPLLITLMTSAAAIHEATAMFDVRVAFESDRHVSQFEQHVHSSLEVMPFWVRATGDLLRHHLLSDVGSSRLEVRGQRQLLGKLALDSFCGPQLVDQLAGHLLVLVPADFRAAMARPFPPFLRYRSSSSPSGCTVTKPSPMRVAPSVASGPKADTKIGDGASGIE